MAKLAIRPRIGTAWQSALLGLILANGVVPLLGQTRDADWSDEVLYFVVLDRFADGEPANNRAVNLSGRGSFHGGDLKGLIQKLDYLNTLGVTVGLKGLPGNPRSGCQNQLNSEWISASSSHALRE